MEVFGVICVELPSEVSFRQQKHLGKGQERPLFQLQTCSFSNVKLMEFFSGQDQDKISLSLSLYIYMNVN